MYPNDVFWGAQSGTAIDGVTVVPTSVYSANYQKIVDTLKASQGERARDSGDDPDISTLTYVTTVPPYITSGGKVVIGPDGKPMTFLSSKGGNLITPGARWPRSRPTASSPSPAPPTSGSGTASPAPSSTPAASRPTTRAGPTATSHSRQPDAGARPLWGRPLSRRGLSPEDPDRGVQRRDQADRHGGGYKVFDFAAEWANLKAHPVEVAGMTLSLAYLSGGLISYDGFHQTSTGSAILANLIIQFINENYGTSIPQADLWPFLFNGNTSPGGYPVGGAAKSNSIDETIEWAAAVYTPETMKG